MSQVKDQSTVMEKSGSNGSSDVERELGSIDSGKNSKNFFQRFNDFMAKISGETRGIERIPESERHDDSFWDTATMWVGANFCIAALSLGGLGISTFGMTIQDSIATIICFCLLGTIPVAALSTFGPPTGMRQMVLSRYWFGSYGARICAFINALTCVGWSSVNTVTAVNTLHFVNYQGRNIPVWGAVITLALISMIVAILGYRFVHFYERYAWMPVFVVFFVICICLGQDKMAYWDSMGSGSAEAASVLSFGGAVYGFAAGWGPYASDYTCYKPKDTSRTKVFLTIAFWGTASCAAPMIIGAFMQARTYTPGPAGEAYLKAYTGGAYDDEMLNSTGALLWKVLVEDKLHGFGQVCMVVMAFSVIANNVPNLYTFGVSARAVLPWFEYFPNYVWNIVITGASIGIAIPAAKNFYSYLQYFMDMIAYWISFYYGIVFAEVLWFRRTYDNYNIDAYDSYVRLPFGFAAIFAGCCGAAGACVGMSQVWWIGPLGRYVGGPDGGDIGYCLSFGFGFVGLSLTRWIERWLFPDESYVEGTDKAWWRLGFINFPHLKTPQWTAKFDNRYWWARKTNQAPPGQGGPAEGPYTHDVNYNPGAFNRNRDIEESAEALK